MDARVPPVERQPDAEGQPHLPEDLHDRIGQMVLVGFRGMTPHEAESTLRHIRAGSIGGVVLYDVDAQTGEPRNIESPQQLKALVTAVKDAGPIPPLVTVDAEGGFFHKLKPQYGFAPTASARDVGERDDPAFTRFNAGVIDDGRQVHVDAGVGQLAVQPRRPLPLAGPSGRDRPRSRVHPDPPRARRPYRPQALPRHEWKPEAIYAGSQ